MRRVIRILTALVIAKQIALAPALAAGPAITQEETEKFVNSFYRDLEGDDLDQVMTHFDETVDYYTFGKKERSYIASELGRYFDYYPSRSFSVSEIKLKSGPSPGSVTVNFDLHSFLRNPDRDTTSSGSAHVEWDLVKRDGAVKIVRFAGTAADSPASPSPSNSNR